MLCKLCEVSLNLNQQDVSLILRQYSSRLMTLTNEFKDSWEKKHFVKIFQTAILCCLSNRVT